MKFLDTDVVIDLLRGYKPALAWLSNLEEAPALPGFVVLELLDGCQTKREILVLKKRLSHFRVFWPTDTHSDLALDTFSNFHLSHGIDAMDALIEEMVNGLGATLCTFNARHFKVIKTLKLEQPYLRAIEPA